MKLEEFVGQTRLKELLLTILTRSDKVVSIILRGSYGSGKTTLARLVASAVCIFTYQLPVQGQVAISQKIPLHIIDEAHQIKNFESLYPAMGKYNFIFCTNLGSQLPEPFINRCYSFRIMPYTVDQLATIIGYHARQERVEFTPAACRYIAERIKGRPRTGVLLTQKIALLTRSNLVTTDIVKELFRYHFDISDDGMGYLDRQYLDAVKTGPKSKATLKAILGVDSEELQRVESYFIHTGMVNITSRGRNYGHQ